MRGRGWTALTACVVALASPSTATAGSLENGAWSDTYIESGDGTRLHADVFRPNHVAAHERTPVILLISPYLGNQRPAGRGYVPDDDEPTVRNYTRPVFEAALARGYTIVQVTLRGFGSSGGCSDFQGPGEQADVAAAIRWAATQPWSTGKVGTYGGSYEGWTQVVGLAQRVPGHAAAVVMAPVVDSYRTHYMNGNRYSDGLYTLDWVGGYGQSSTLPAPGGASPEEQSEAAEGGAQQPICTIETAEGTLGSDSTTPFWRERTLSPRLAGATVPTLLATGFLDANVKQDQFPLLWDALAGPKRLWLMQDNHQESSAWLDRTGQGGEEWTRQVLRWFDRYVKGLPESEAPVGTDPRVLVQRGYDGKWRAEEAWPPEDTATVDMPIRPGTYLDVAGNKAEPGFGPGNTACRDVQPRCGPAPRHGVGSWTFSRPFARHAHIAGPARVSVEIDQSAPQVNVVAILYDVDAQNRAAVLTRGVYVSRGSGNVSFDLYPQDWDLHPGHRLGLLLSGSDDYWFSAGRSGTEVEVKGGRLRLPLLGYERTTFVPGGPSVLIEERPTFPVQPDDATVHWPGDAAP